MAAVMGLWPGVEVPYWEEFHEGGYPPVRCDRCGVARGSGWYCRRMDRWVCHECSYREVPLEYRAREQRRRLALDRAWQREEAR